MRALGISERTVQDWAKKGRLKYKTIRQGGRRFRLYDASGVDKLRELGPPKADPLAEPDYVIDSEGAVTKGGREKRDQGARALDTVSIVGQILAAQRAELEVRKTELSGLVGQLVEFAKGNHAAEMQRWKDEREDARERWEAEQKRLTAEHEAREAELRRRPWLTLEEAVAESNLTTAAIRQAVKDGLLVATTKGGLRIQRASLEAFSGSRKTATAAAG
jgi:hypothetical protein